MPGCCAGRFVFDANGIVPLGVNTGRGVSGLLAGDKGRDKELEVGTIADGGAAFVAGVIHWSGA